MLGWRSSLWILVVALGATFAASAGAEAGTLDDLKSKGTIRLGVRDDAKPFSYKAADGTSKGYVVDLCRSVVEKLKAAYNLPDLKTEYVTVTTQSRFDALRDGKADLLCGPDTVTLKRREMVSFSVPVFITGAGVMYRSDGPSSLYDLKDKKVGVKSSTTTETVLRDILKKLDINAEVVTYDSYQAGADALKANQISVFFGDRGILVDLLNQANDEQLKLGDLMLSAETYALGLRRDDEDFRLAVDRALSQIYKSKELTHLIRDNFGSRPPGPILEALFLASALPE
jgi:polar amino acid transport system substrate-binding protein/glutamate/aspartate transport system substrate-binding protein